MTKDNMYAPGLADELALIPTKRVRVDYRIREEPHTKEFPLEVHYKFLRKTLYLWIPIPSGYSSGLTKKLREERPPYNDLAYVQIDSRKRDKAHTPPGKENEAERLRNNYLYLEWFYVRPQQFRGDSTSTERASLAGLGKKLLCAAIFLMVEKGFVTDPATAVIGLEAGGGHCEMSKDSKKRKALTMSDEDLRKYLLQHKATNRYVEVTTKKMKTEEDKAKFRRTTVCEIEDNRELAGYYRHQYGFEIFDDSNGLGFLMEAPLMTVIGNCGDTYRRPDALPDLTAAHALPATRTTRSASSAPTAARTPAPVPVPTQAARALTRRIRAPPPQLPPPPPPPPPLPVPVRRPARKRKQPPGAEGDAVADAAADEGADAVAPDSEDLTHANPTCRAQNGFTFFSTKRQPVLDRRPRYVLKEIFNGFSVP
eukprot:jgi/Mesvir1/16992/Mv19368-RA.1